MNGIRSPVLLNQEKLLDIDMQNLALINERFRAKSLKSSLDHLSNEVCILYPLKTSKKMHTDHSSVCSLE